MVFNRQICIEYLLKVAHNRQFLEIFLSLGTSRALRIRIRVKPFGALSDIFVVIAHNPPAPIDEDFETSAIGFCSQDESSLHIVHGQYCR